MEPELKNSMDKEDLNQDVPVPHQNHKNKITIFELVFVFVVLILIGSWFLVKNIFYVEPVQRDEIVIDVEDELNIISGSVEFYKNPSVIKTIEENNNWRVQILDIGLITEGNFKGKSLYLAVSFYENATIRDKYFGGYMYYIPGDNLLPLAYDSSFGVLSGSLNKVVVFSDDLKTEFDFMPKELSISTKLVETDKGYFSMNLYSNNPLENINTSLDNRYQIVTYTKSGAPIIKITDQVIAGQAFPSTNYYIRFPFGEIRVNPVPDFLNGSIPKLTWTVGGKTVSDYRYGQYAYGWKDCYDGISQDQFKSDLIQTGLTVNGDEIYELNSEKYPNTYKCLHEKTRRYVYDPNTQTGEYKETVSYEDFVVSHPMFFWVNEPGDLMPFLRVDVVPPAEKAKPVIYLYPEREEEIDVNVFPIGGFTKTDPDYGNGWSVIATPGGLITNIADNKQYPYLFWEGGGDGVVETPRQGFVVKKENVSELLENTLIQFGLDEKERDDFLEFWAPKLNKAPYYFITFISQSEIDRVAPMQVYPKPDNVIRVLMDYKPLLEPIDVYPLEIKSTKRDGFTVVEWGGIVRD